MVEDDERMGRVWERTLRQSCKVTVVPTLAAGRRALDSATRARTPYSAVVIDIGLPDGEGTDLIPRALSLKPTPGIAVVSGNLESDQVVGLCKKGVFPVPKPVGYSTGKRLVATLIAQSRRERPSVAQTAGLSAREIEVVRLASIGFEDDAIAEAFSCTRSTIRTYWQRVYRKLGVSSVRGALAVLNHPG